MKKLMFSLFAAMMLIGVQAMAQDATNEKPIWQPSVGINLSYSSRYISDGWVVNPESMIFGDINLTWDFNEFGGIYIGTWFANDWNDYNKGDRIDYEPEEWDYWFGYYYTLGDIPVVDSLTFDLSYTYWDYPKRTGWPKPGETERKVVLDISTGDFAITEDFTWHPGIYFGWDHENDEWQVKLYVKSSYKISDKLSFNNGLDLFWNNGRWRRGSWRHNHHDKQDKVFDEDGRSMSDQYKNGFSTLVWSTDLSYAINDYISFGPFAKLAWVLDHDYREVWKSNGNDDHKSGVNNLWGVQLSISF